MAYTTIDKSSLHFNTKLYTGTGSSSTKTGVGFQPDLTWVKARNNTTWHYLYDAVRTAGIEKELHSNSTAAEGDSDGAAYGYLSAFTSDGFSTVIGSNASSDGLNKSGTNFVSWNWKAGGGQGSSNTDGTINTTYTSANTTAGFSIVKYTGTGSNATVGHGLGVAPEVVWIKKLSGGGNEGMYAYMKTIGAGNALSLSETVASAAGSTLFNSTDPTSSVFSVGSHSATNASGSTYSWSTPEKISGETGSAGINSATIILYKFDI